MRVGVGWAALRHQQQHAEQRPQQSLDQRRQQDGPTGQPSTGQPAHHQCQAVGGHENRQHLRGLRGHAEPQQAAVDANGGDIQVKQVEANAQGKTRGFPIAVIGLAIEVVRLLRGDPAEQLYKSAGNYDADIMVRQGPSGERVIERVVLKRRPTP